MTMRTITKLICPDVDCAGHIDRKIDMEQKELTGYCRKCGQIAVGAK